MNTPTQKYNNDTKNTVGNDPKVTNDQNHVSKDQAGKVATDKAASDLAKKNADANR